MRMVAAHPDAGWPAGGPSVAVTVSSLTRDREPPRHRSLPPSPRHGFLAADSARAKPRTCHAMGDRASTLP